MSVRDLLVIGAGPSGLATAIAAQRAGLDCLVLEKGGLVESIYRFPIQMVFFTTPELLEIGGFPFTTLHDKPTRAEALRYYRRVADACRLPLALYEEALGVERRDGPEGSRFAVPARRTGGGARRTHEARAVVLAMGYYDHPNWLGVPGEDLPHVSHYYREPHPHYRQRVVVVGGRNSACEAALELSRAGADVTLVHRGSTLGDSVKYWVRPDIENRIAEGAVRARFRTRVVEVRAASVIVAPVDGAGAVEELPADAVLLLTGYHADADFLRRAGVDLEEESEAPRHDPETFETNVPNLFVAGGLLGGRRTGSIFIENGRFHGEAIVRALAARGRKPRG